MIGVLIKDGVNIIDKQVFVGDEAVVGLNISQQTAKNPQWSFEIHKDTDPDWKTAFETIKTSPIATQEQMNWQTVKGLGTNAAIDFLAKKMGLE